MTKFKKYLPQLIVFILHAFIIWWITNTARINDLKSIEAMFMWFIIAVLGYGLASAAEPKK